MAKDTFVISAERHEISRAEFQRVLEQYLRQQGLLVSLGAKRKPDQKTDRLSVAVTKNGKLEEGWWMQEVQCNWNGVIGEMRVALTIGSTRKGVWVSYNAHTQELRSVPSRIPMPVYP